MGSKNVHGTACSYSKLNWIVLLGGLFVGGVIFMACQVICPFIASLFNGSPLLISWVLGIILSLACASSFLCLKRRSTSWLVLLLGLITSGASIGVIYNRFGERTYTGGYIQPYYYGVGTPLFNRFGFELIGENHKDYYLANSVGFGKVILAVTYYDNPCYAFTTDMYTAKGEFIDRITIGPDDRIYHPNNLTGIRSVFEEIDGIVNVTAHISSDW